MDERKKSFDISNSFCFIDRAFCIPMRCEIVHRCHQGHTGALARPAEYCIRETLPALGLVPFQGRMSKSSQVSRQKIEKIWNMGNGRLDGGCCLPGSMRH